MQGTGNRSLLHRLFSVEVIAGAFVGAAAPYTIALVVEVAPTRVPLGLVVISIGGGALLGWLLVTAMNGRKRRLRARARRDLERREMRARLRRIEQAIASEPPTTRDS